MVQQHTQHSTYRFRLCDMGIEQMYDDGINQCIVVNWPKPKSEADGSFFPLFFN